MGEVVCEARRRLGHRGQEDRVRDEHGDDLPERHEDGQAQRSGTEAPAAGPATGLPVGVQASPFVMIFGGNGVGGLAWLGEDLLVGREGAPNRHGQLLSEARIRRLAFRKTPVSVSRACRGLASGMSMTSLMPGGVPPITATRSPSRMASSMSWVTNRMVVRC